MLFLHEFMMLEECSDEAVQDQIEEDIRVCKYTVTSTITIVIGVMMQALA